MRKLLFWLAFVVGSTCLGCQSIVEVARPPKGIMVEPTPRVHVEVVAKPTPIRNPEYSLVLFATHIGIGYATVQAPNGRKFLVIVDTNDDYSESGADICWIGIDKKFFLRLIKVAGIKLPP